MKTLLFFYVLGIALECNAQGANISGNSTVVPGSTETYYANWQSWDQTYSYYANVQWDVSGGTVLYSDKGSVTIQWNSLLGFGDFEGYVSVVEDLNGQNGSKMVTIVNTYESTSEFCNGILGPPRVFVDFGAGTNPGAPLGSTTYQYNSICGLDPGQYTIRNNSINCRSLWHGIPSDHTGNPNGYFFMVNAGSDRSEIYRTTITGFTPSFSYEFSAWVGNLYNVTGSPLPRVRFEIYDLGGTLLASSGSIAVQETLPTFQWQKIGFMFKLAAGSPTSIQVVVINARGTQTSNDGNDMVIDDISFAPCYPGILASFSGSSIVDKAHTCNSGTVNLYSSWPSTIPFSSPSYQWQRSADEGNSWQNISGATTINYSHTESAPGIYTYRMLAYETSNPSQNVTSNEIVYYVQTIQVDAKITLFYSCNGAGASDYLSGDYHFLYGDPAEAASLSYTFAWSPSTYLNSATANPTYISLPGLPTPSSTATAPNQIDYSYTLTVTNTNYGCSASNTQIARLRSPRKVGVPSAFSPNGDGINDVFRAINLQDYPGAIFRIYNRWGQQIFHGEGSSQADYTWNGYVNGVRQPQEVYLWTVFLPGCASNIYSGSNGDGINYGDVTLLW